MGEFGLPPERSESVNRLFNNLEDLRYHECTSKRNLVRWLKSRNWDEEDAERMLRAHINWRKENNVDTILSWYVLPEVVDKYFPGGICGSDKNGRPLYIAPVGYLDPKSFMKAVSRSDFLKSRVYQMEFIISEILPKYSEKAGRNIDQLTVIMDMHGLGFKHMSPSWLSIVTESVTVLEANYPEVLGVCFVINAPPLFSKLYSFIKPLLSKATQEKIHILNSNYRETLLRHFDLEGLPGVYGGTMVDPDGDPRCPSRICWAGPVPEEYFTQLRQPGVEPHPAARRSISRSTSAQSLGSTDQFTAVEVSRGAQLDVPIGFLSAGVELNWCVICESHDIGIGWFVQPVEMNQNPGIAVLPTISNGFPSNTLGVLNESPKVNAEDISTDANDTLRDGLWEVVPMQRIITRLTPFRGKYRIQVAGSYYMRLDNSYSWMRVKHVRYVLKVTIPKELTEQNSVPRMIPSSVSVDALDQHNRNSRFVDETNIVDTFNEISVFPVPDENSSQSLLITGGSMDVNISLLFRLLAQLLLVPKFSPSRHPTS
ncbi:uncharacterized protein DEA37_0008570 [Paragonimus westermani]|uniref:CRAL-TRIO domain-containing protein n=1 Tax=Paragonimus westermani TaxID=34504 RepID=A0A5J4NS48_9TREM|nr:uncharacterized protein DEA37_0008570 [Paragonimus westermani]